MKKLKLVVFGLDALSLEILARNRFPAIEKFDVRTMMSTIPYITPPGWTTMWTGLNPAVHGITGIQSLRDWKSYGSEERKLYLDDMTSFPHFRIWDYLSANGLRCVVRDIPLSLPIHRESNADVGVEIFADPSEGFWRGYGRRSLPSDKRGHKVAENKQHSFSTVYEKVKTYKEYLSKAEEIDVLFLGFNEIDPSCHLKGIQSKDTQEILLAISELIEAFADYPVLIVSDHGFETFTLRLHVDNFLMGRGLFVKKNGKGDFEKSIAYPVDCGKHRVTTQEFGIYLNTEEKESGFLSSERAVEIQSELIAQLSKIPGVQAIPKWQYYDPSRLFYDSLPEILLTSDNCQTFFICLHENEHEVLEAWGGTSHSRRAVFATNFEYERSRNVAQIDEVYRFICEQMGIEVDFMTGTPLIANISKEDQEKAEVMVVERLKLLGYIK